MGPIGVFDSGYGGLTILKAFVRELPEYDFVYLGDNARSPYGTRSFDSVYQYTLQAVEWLFKQGCPLVILACNTASAKALRTIQQQDLQKFGREKRVLGVIRPTAEIIGKYSNSKHIGLFATPGTVQSQSYLIEINKFFPEITVSQEACPMWVPLIENNLHNSEGADYFIKQHVESLLLKDPEIDTILLACTHYPLISKSIEKYLSRPIKLVSQAEIIAKSLFEYLENHKEIADSCQKKGSLMFYTTGDPQDFDNHATLFFGKAVISDKISLT